MEVDGLERWVSFIFNWVTFIIGKMVGAPWDGTLKNQPHIIHLILVGIYYCSYSFLKGSLGDF